MIVNAGLKPANQRGRNMQGKIFKATALGAAVLLLTACSGEPSEGDIREAIEAQFAATNEQVEAFAGSAMDTEGMKAELHSVEKIGCAEDGHAKAYVCEVKLDSSAPLIGRQQAVTKVRLAKTSDGWAVAQ